MSYVVLARKWRPKKFEDLLGQNHVAITLSNAIKRGRIAHAFLFTGVRGVGKTSAARILSMALNCKAFTNPTPEPCGVCEACVSIMNSTCVDVQEIDGASNNSVDDVRNLRETVIYRPVSCRTKIYIIDEVHMLSQSAFNALLKTLEEPPEHVKFIFATTEPHRIPITILSRCQRYDFRKIPASVIEKQIHRIIDDEKIEMEQEAISLIAREAQGSMRDALSLLDQIVAAFESPIKAKDVFDLVGIPAPEIKIKLSGAIFERNAREALAIVDKLDREGYDLVRFFEGYLSDIKDMMVVKSIGKDCSFLEITSWEMEEIWKLIQKTEIPELYRLFTNIYKSLELAHYAPTPKVVFESMLVKLCQREPLVTIEQILKRLTNLKNQMPEHSPEVSFKKQSPESSFSKNISRTVKDEGMKGDGKIEENPVGFAEPGGFEGKPESKKWDEVLKRVTEMRPSLGHTLKDAVLLEFGGGVVKIGFSASGFGSSFVKDRENSELIKKMIEEVTGKKHELIVLERNPDAIRIKEEREHILNVNRKKKIEDAKSDPVVTKTVATFGGEIVDIKIDME